MGFTERFAAVGMDSPIDPAFVKTLSETLYERLDLAGRREELSEAGETISRAALAQMLYDQAGESAVTAATAFADVSPDAGYAGAAGTGGDLSGFADAETVSGWAAEAVAWASEKGLFAAEDGARLDPRGETTRVETAAMLLRAKWLE